MSPGSARPGVLALLGRSPTFEYCEVRSPVSPSIDGECGNSIIRRRSTAGATRPCSAMLSRLVLGNGRSHSRPRNTLGARLSRAVIPALLCACLAQREAAADRAVARSLVEEGERLSSAGRPGRALERLERAIDEDPDYLPAYEAAVRLWLRDDK